ncbi:MULTISPECIES: hypothetical protein [unclassified Microcoleus]|uniref:hypothetical protein n=1 Tax=unclassified Microcoleus TaxID=2642155 RepID=UPI0025CC539F|nr:MULTISPECIES: hypothetical protein [unclassified Microcoleus]
MFFAQVFANSSFYWDSKVYSIKEVAKLINIGTDTIAFVDDKIFELEEVNFSLPEVLYINDKYENYGKIGLALLEYSDSFWTIKLFLMSCRVMFRGVGTVMLNYLLELAKDNNVRLRAEFLSNNRNRMMYISYKFSGFPEIDNNGALVILENDLQTIQPYPKYMNIEIIN